MLKLIIIIAIIIAIIYYQKQQQQNNSQNNKTRNTATIKNETPTNNSETVTIESTEAKTVKPVEHKEVIENDGNDPKYIAVREKIDKEFVEPKEPAPMQIDVSFKELKVLYYRRHIFKRSEPLPKSVSEYMDTYNDLFNNGYFEQANVESVLKKICKIENLKEYLKTNDLALSGTKDVLIKRILDNISPDKLENDFEISDYYILSDKGKKIIDKYPYSLVDRRDFEVIVKKFYNLINKDILLKNLDFAAENIKFTDEYKEYDLPIKALVLAYKDEADFDYDTYTNHYFNAYTEIFKELYGVTIPNNVFIQVKGYYHSFKELKRDRKNSDILPTYKIKTTEDARTCSFCKKMNNKEFPYSDAKIGINYPPFYDCKCDFCRCYVECIFDNNIFED